MSLGRLLGAVDPVSIHLTRAKIGNKPVPYPIRSFGKVEPVGFMLVPGGFKKTKLHPGGMFGKKGKIDPASVPGSAQGIGLSRLYDHRFSSVYSAFFSFFDR